jgi:hypothetical protein
MEEEEEGKSLQRLLWSWRRRRGGVNNGCYGKRNGEKSIMVVTVMETGGGGVCYGGYSIEELKWFGQ